VAVPVTAIEPVAATPETLSSNAIASNIVSSLRRRARRMAAEIGESSPKRVSHELSFKMFSTNAPLVALPIVTGKRYSMLLH